MSGGAALDLRYPIGGLFTVLGLILAGFGLATRENAAMYARSQGLNVNLAWGVVMVVVGLLFLFLARRGSRTGHDAAMHTSSTTPEGQATEAREKALGLER